MPDLIAAAAQATGVPADVQWQHLEACEDAGTLVVLAVDIGEIVGFAVAVVGPEFFRAGLSCTTLSIFVHRAHRWRWGLRLLLALRRSAAAHQAKFRLQAIPDSRLAVVAAKVLGMQAVAVTFE